MADFSERDLLILSNYVYFNCSSSAKEKCIGDTINRFKLEDGSFDVNKMYHEGAISCNISEEEAVDLFIRIDNDEKLKNLHVARKLETWDVRAVCFADENEQNACVVFRGTGGTYDAWYDNVEGEYKKDTDIQKMAADFVRNECAQYNNLTVAGHSKGGNLAQYATVVCGSQIANCISFDGQGFGKNFLREYRNEIKVAKTKIKSISAYNDYVNILLTPIAGERLFLRNNGKDIDGHSSATLLNSIKFNENGEIDLKSSKTLQGLPAFMLEKIADDLVDIIDLLPDGGSEKATNIVASLVAGYMSNDKGEEYEKNQFREAVKAFGSYSSNVLDIVTINEIPVNIIFTMAYVNNGEMKKAYDTMYDSVIGLSRIIEKVRELNTNITYMMVSRQYTDAVILKIIEKLELCRKRILEHTNVLLKVHDIYQKDDDALIEVMNAMI